MDKSQKIKYGIVGFGAWGRCYANAIAKVPDVELAAIATGDNAEIAKTQAEFPGVAVCSDYRELIARSDVDVVALVTPNHLHHRMGIDILNAGKHLLVEKPYTISISDCDELTRLAEQKKLHLAVGHQFRLSSLWGRIKTMIDDGFVGRPRYVLVELSRNPYRLGADGWRFDIHRVGNWILEEPVHFLDLARWYVEGFAEPVSLYASANSIQEGHPELQDNLSAIINFSDGTFAVVAQTLSAFEHHQTVKICGTQGSLWAGWSGALDRTLHPEFFLKTFNGEQVENVAIDRTPGELFELEDQIALMADVVRGHKPVHCTGNDGRWAVALSQAALKSADTGLPVTEFFPRI